MRSVAAIIALALAAVTQATEPHLDSMVPRGAKVGTELILRLEGERLGDAEEILFFEPGIEFIAWSKVQDKSLEARIRVRVDCPLGDHRLALRTRTGLSNPKIFAIGSLPEIDEVEPNDVLAQAQAVPLDCSIEALMTARDVDLYAFDVEAPGRLSFEVQGLRLGDSDLDLAFELLDAGGRTAAAVDDSRFGGLDPVLSIDLPAAGRWYLRVHEAAFGGSKTARYRLHLGRFPRPVATMPLGGGPGAELDLRWIGAEGGEKIRIPADASGSFDCFPRSPDGTVAPTPVTLRVFDGVELTGEPPADAPVPAAPCAFQGTIVETNGLARRRFRATKGEEIEIEVFARRLHSELDSVIQVFDPSGKPLSSNDDAKGLDSRLRFRAAEDGVHELRVRDHLRRVGPELYWRAELRPVADEVHLEPRRLDRDRPIQIVVPRGGRAGILIDGSGLPKDGGLRPKALHLPPGLADESTAWTSSSGGAVLLLRAAEDAPLGAGLVGLGAVDPQGREVPSTAEFVEDLVRVENDRPYVTSDLAALPVAVVEALPFGIEVVPPSLPVVQGASIELEVKVTRKEGFEAPIRLRLLDRPTGIDAATATVAAKESAARLRLEAKGDAAPGKRSIAVLAFADVEGGEAVTGGDFVEIEVVRPWISVDMQSVRAARGEEVRLGVVMERLEDFDAPLEPVLESLPSGVAVKAPELRSTDREFEFALSVGPRVPIGRFRNLRLTIDVPTPIGLLRHQFQGGELRIDEKPETLPAGAAGPAGTTKGTLERPRT